MLQLKGVSKDLILSLMKLYACINFFEEEIHDASELHSLEERVSISSSLNTFTYSEEEEVFIKKDVSSTRDCNLTCQCNMVKQVPEMGLEGNRKGN